MKKAKKIIYVLLLSLNLLCIVLLLISAYGPMLNPQHFAKISLLSFLFPVLAIINIAFVFLWIIIRWKYLFFSLVTLLLCFTQLRDYCPVNFSQEVPQQSIKLLSYNVMGFGENKKKTQDVIDLSLYLKNSNADIICFQEFSNITSYQKLLNEEMKEKYPYIKINKLEGNTFACLSKYPILSEEAFELGDEHINQAVLYKIAIKNDTLSIYDIHLQSNDLSHAERGFYKDFVDSRNIEKVKNDTTKTLFRKLANAKVKRAKEVEKLISIIKSRNQDYVVVCGDFNDTPVSHTHNKLTKIFTDAHTQSGCGIDYSYNRNYFYFRIDHILISKKLRSYNCNVESDISISDHYPITCSITFE